MDCTLLRMAGGDPAPADAIDPDCIAAIAGAVERLRQQGKPAGMIVAALATVSVAVLDQQRRH